MRGTLAGLVVVLVVAAAAPATADDAPAPKVPPAEESVDALVARAVGAGPRADEAAVAAVLRRRSEDVVPALERALLAQTGFHQRITLGYMLAVHGEKAGLQVLVDSLEETGHLGYVYLTRVAPEDFGWNQDGSSLARWREWLGRFSEAEYRERTRRSRLPKNAREAGDEELRAAATALRDGADRASAAAKFRGIVARFPDADAAPRALEVADSLDAEVKEDAVWKEPATPPAPGDPNRVAWLVHHLRDVRGFERHSISYTTVLPPRRRGEPAVETPATAFVAMGPAAVPTLLGLLEDRRPIRAFGWTTYRAGPREWRSRLVVLRVQDAALEILNVLLPTPTYERKHTATYLSAEDPPDREALIADVRSWAEQTLGKTGDEATWAGVRRAKAEDAVAQLRRLANEGKKKEVLDELRRMYAERSWLFRPIIVELMAELGDRSKVDEIVRTLADGAYTSHGYVEDGDSAVGLNAESAAQRVRDKYGKGAGGGRDESPPK